MADRIEESIAGTAEEVFASLTREAQAALDGVMRALLTVELGEDNAVKARRCPLAAVQEIPGAKSLIQAFAGAGIFTTGRLDDGSEALVFASSSLLGSWPRLQKWLGQNMTKLIARERIRVSATLWLSETGSDRYLIQTPSQLTEVEAMLSDPTEILPRKERAFIEASLAKAAAAPHQPSASPPETAARGAGRSAEMRALGVLVLGVALGVGALRLNDRLTSGLTTGAAPPNTRATAQVASPAVPSAAVSEVEAAVPASVLSPPIEKTRASSTEKPSTGESQSPRPPRESPEPQLVAEAKRILDDEGGDAVERLGDAIVVADRSLKELGRIVEPAKQALNHLLARPWEYAALPSRGEDQAIAFSGDGTMLASVPTETQLNFWRNLDDWSTAADKDLARSGTGLPGADHSPYFSSRVVVNGDGRQIFCGGNDGRVLFWDPALNGSRFEPLEQINPATVLEGATDELRSPEQYEGSSVPFANMYVTNDPEKPSPRTAKTLREWLERQPARTSHADTVLVQGPPCAMGLSRDARVLAVGTDLGLVLLWNLKSDRLLAAWRAHLASVTSLAFSPDGSKVLTGSSGGAVRCWDVSGKPMGKVAKLKGGRILHVAYSKDGSGAAAVGGNGEVSWLDIHGNVAKAGLGVEFDAPVSAALTPDLRRLCVAEKSELKVVSLDTGRVVDAMAVGRIAYGRVIVSSDGHKLAVGCGDGAVRLYDTGVAPLESGAASKPAELLAMACRRYQYRANPKSTVLREALDRHLGR